MPESIAQRLLSLPLLGNKQLRGLWEELFHAPTALKMRRDFMIPILCYRLQEREFGPIAKPIRKRLERLAQQGHAAPDRFVSHPRLSPGTRLVRQWDNRVHVVNVESSGYEYAGTRYQSLSQIARLITGTRWSGPVFFGVKNKKAKRGTSNESARA
jgi:hypothetical protein